MTHANIPRVEPPHEDVDRLGDYLDGALDPDERSAIDDHLARCADCRARLGALRLLVERAAHAPVSIEPEDDLWPEVHQAIEARRTLTLPLSGAASRSGTWATRRVVAGAAAALFVVAALSPATTALLLRRATPAAPVAERTFGTGGEEALVRYAALERDYERSARELWAALEDQRETLSPATIETVERSVATIDRAIAEAREALLRDPGNKVLVEMLTASQEQKWDLLRRATRLTAGT